MTRHPEFTAVLFVLCICTFGWPFISIPGGDSLEAMFYYLFISWAIVIGILLLVALLGNNEGEKGREPN